MKIFVAILTISLLLAFGIGCSGGSDTQTSRTGTPYIFSPGIPSFEMTAAPTWHFEERGLGITVSVSNTSLVFVRDKDSYIATYEISVQIYEKEQETLLLEKAWVETTNVPDYESTQLKQAKRSSYFLELSQGEYTVIVSLRDENSAKLGSRRLNVKLTPVESMELSFASLGLEERQPDGSYQNVLPFRVIEGHDSVRVFGVVNAPLKAASLDVSLLVVKFPSDTSVAAPPFLFSPVAGTFSRHGVNYSTPDTIGLARSLISVRGRQIDFSIPVDLPDKSFYRIYLSITALSDANREPLSVMNDQAEIVVLGAGYPRPQTIDALIEPLVYIAKEEQMDSLRLAPTTEEKKRRFDALWLSFADNKAAAAHAIKLYYTRVEEANKYFTTQKEGWKTDRGMLYIVLGPPVSSGVRLQKEIWFYSSTDPDPINTYYFTKVRPNDNESTIENPTLDRQSYYDRGWQRAVERWRNGSVF
ncbi:MAG TPA: GWxTD domain-containing protein [Bacteroidota bacterium]